MTRRFFVAAVLVASVLSGAEAVAAHADPSIVSPAACSTADAGDTVMIEFTEELLADGSRMELIADGVSIAVAGIDLADLEHKTIVTTIPTGVEGQVTVKWDSLSAVDEDSGSGSYGISVGSASPAADCGFSAAESTGGGLPIVAIGGLTVAVAAALALANSRRDELVEA